MADWKQQFKEGQKLRARVIYVDPTAKSIALSLLPHLLKMAPLTLPTVGSLLKVRVFLSSTWHLSPPAKLLADLKNLVQA